MLNHKIVIFYILQIFFNVVFAKQDVCFTPSLECENRIIKLIDKSKNTILLAMYSLNNSNIIEALEKAKERGVEIRIIADRVQASSKSSKVLYLWERGFNVMVNTKHRIEHNKFAIYDDKIVSTGSFNWTNPASKSNSENYTFFTNKNIVKEYIDRFKTLENLYDKEKSNEILNKIKNNSDDSNNKVD